MEAGSWPDSIENRDGAHSGKLQYAASKRTPRPASASSAGVCTTGWPYVPVKCGAS